MRYISVREARRIDEAARERFGIPALVLMENAGSAVAAEVLGRRRAGAVVVICGKGNNGGDGFVCARHLLSAGIIPRVFLLSGFRGVKNEAAVNLRALRRLGCPVTPLITGVVPLKKALRISGLVVDALLGTGGRGAVTGIYAEAIDAVNSSGKFVLSVDVPSGLDADTGLVRGACINAGLTVTFFAPKQGMRKNKGPGVCGSVKVAGLGLPLSMPV